MAKSKEVGPETPAISAPDSTETLERKKNMMIDMTSLYLTLNRDKGITICSVMNLNNAIIFMGTFNEGKQFINSHIGQCKTFKVTWERYK